MKKLLSLGAVLAALLSSGTALARDDHELHSIQDALNVESAKNKLNPAIKLYFGDQKHAAVAKDFGEVSTNKKTNAFGKSDKQSCDWVFLSALLAMQERAQKEGANAIVGIKSNYKNQERSSATEFVCGSGALMSGVALKGQIVKLAD